MFGISSANSLDMGAPMLNIVRETDFATRASRKLARTTSRPSRLAILDWNENPRPGFGNHYAQYYAHPVHRSIALRCYLRWKKPM